MNMFSKKLVILIFAVLLSIPAANAKQENDDYISEAQVMASGKSSLSVNSATTISCAWSGCSGKFSQLVDHFFTDHKIYLFVTDDLIDKFSNVPVDSLSSLPTILLTSILRM